ncbi:MAG: hypothetical protein HDR74_09610 [Bacteroides sp.]|nr:hypothetical protein [Bacteroides sp.]
MKSLKQILLLLTFMITVPAYADDIPNDDVDEISINPDTDPGNNGNRNPINRPKSVNRQQIHCHYNDGMLFIQFAISEGSCELTVVDNETGESVIYYFDSSIGSFINIGNINSFDLYIETEKGNFYFGSKL